MMEALPYILIGAVGFVSGIFSGISGGGGAMLMIPAFIFAGLPPQAAVASAKMSGLGADFGGLRAFLKSGHVRKDITRVMIPIAIIIGLVIPFIFVTLEGRTFQIAIAILMIALLPTLFIKRKKLKPPTRKYKFFGYSLYTGVLFLQGLFSGGVGSLAVYVLTLVLGTSKIEAMATRRAIVAVLSPIVFIALLVTGFVHIGLGLAGLITAFIGTHIGTKIVLRSGETFVSIVMASTILMSSIALLVTAL